jgi:hypothetical protein
MYLSENIQIFYWAGGSLHHDNALLHLAVSVNRRNPASK